MKSNTSPLSVLWEGKQTELGLSARHRACWNHGPGMQKGCGPTCLWQAREAACGQGEPGPEAWAQALDGMLLC